MVIFFIITIIKTTTFIEKTGILQCPPDMAPQRLHPRKLLLDISLEKTVVCKRWISWRDELLLLIFENQRWHVWKSKISWTACPMIFAYFCAGSTEFDQCNELQVIMYRRLCNITASCDESICACPSMLTSHLPKSLQIFPTKMTPSKTPLSAPHVEHRPWGAVEVSTSSGFNQSNLDLLELPINQRFRRFPIILEFNQQNANP